MNFVYLLIVYHFHFGFEYDHTEAFKTYKSCINRGNHLPKYLYPDFELIKSSERASVACKKVQIK